MRNFALTYPQLMSQALACGLERSELLRLQRAHELAEAMGDGLYRAQGVPFLNHLVRTASIALADGHRPDVVLAALLHSACMLHRFSDSRRRAPGPRIRRRLRRVAGDEVEAILAAYVALPWRNAGDRAAHLAGLAGYDERRRQVVALRLANDLEDFLDGGMQYGGPQHDSAKVAEHGQQCVALAEALGLGPLAADLREVFAQQRDATPAQAALQTGHRIAYERKRRHLWEAGLATRTLRRCVRALRRLKGRVVS